MRVNENSIYPFANQLPGQLYCVLPYPRQAPEFCRRANLGKPVLGFVSGSGPMFDRETDPVIGQQGH